MPVRNDHHIRRLLAVHVRSLHASDPRNDLVQPARELRRALAALAPVMPDIPGPLRVQAPLLAAAADLRRQQALVDAVLPLPHILGDLDRVLQGRLRGLVEQQLEGAPGPRAWTNDDLGELRGVDGLPVADDDFARLKHLRLADGGQGDVATAGVAAGNGPFCLALMVLARM